MCIRDRAEHVATPITFWDESLTTVEATASLHAQGRRGKQVKERVDAVAAALILQSYLDAQRSDAQRSDAQRSDAQRPENLYEE